MLNPVFDSIVRWFVIPPDSLIVTGHYDGWLVTLSVLIAIFAAYVALQVASYKSNCVTKTCSRATIFVGGLALGGGTWSMHFIGMIAFNMNTSVSYHLELTLLSMIPSVLASWVALNYIVARHSGPVPLIISGVLVGAGIGSMHYLGMAAMEMAPLLRYDPFMFSLSIVVAVLLATLSLWLRFYLGRLLTDQLYPLVNILAAIVMGSAISGMHYVGMAAARFVLPIGVELDLPTSEMSKVLAIGVTSVTFVIIGVVLAVTTISKYKAISRQIEESQSRLLATMDSAVDGIITINDKGIVVSVNKAVTKLLGWQPHELEGYNVKKIVPAPHNHNHDGYIKHYLETGEAKIIGIGREVEALHKAGYTIAIRLSIGHAKLPDEDFFVAFITDIRQRLTMEQELRENEAKFRTLVRNIPGAAYRRLNKPGWPMVHVSQAIEELTGYSAEAFLLPHPSLNLSSLINESDLKEAIEAQAKYSNHSVQYRLTRADGTECWLVDHYKIFTDEEGNEYVDGFIMDITDKVHYEKQITRYKALVDFSQDAIMSVSLDGEVLTWNDSAKTLYGYTAEEMVGRSVTLLSGLSPAEERKLINSVVQGTKRRHYRSKYRHKNGSHLYVSLSASPIYDADGVVRSISKISRDVTHEVMQEQNIKHQVEHDHLTGLLSRIGITNAIKEELHTSLIQHSSCALMFIDLDNFKLYNDTYGHDFGDHLLQTVSSVLKEHTRANDSVGRLGGDEFVICLTCITDRQVVKNIATEIVDGISSVQSVDDIPLKLTASLGIAVCPDDSADLSNLLHKADQAMYEAKRKGKNQIRFFMQSNEDDLSDKSVLIEELSQAIENDELLLHFQPILNLTTGHIEKAEALVRWQHPKKGLLPPNVFIPLAEDNGLAKALGDWVFRTTVSYLTRWVELFGPDFQVSINKSAYEFYDAGEYTHRVDKQLKEAGLQGHNLVIEITERSILEHSKVTEDILKLYREFGVQIALDDFGTGYSSLMHLKRYPVDFLKIDKSFIAFIDSSDVDYHLCSSILSMADKLGIKVIAEGVETKRQYQLLKSMKCELIQGFYFSRPIAADDFEALVKATNTS